VTSGRVIRMHFDQRDPLRVLRCQLLRPICARGWFRGRGEVVIIPGAPDRRLAFEWQLRYIASLYKMAVRSGNQDLQEGISMRDIDDSWSLLMMPLPVSYSTKYGSFKRRESLLRWQPLIVVVAGSIRRPPASAELAASLVACPSS
jgi:hypothetical protein